MPKRTTPKPVPAADMTHRMDDAMDAFSPFFEGERLAFNLFDLDPLHPAVRAKLLPLLDLRKESVAWVDRDAVDETAAPFACDLFTAAQACDVVRGLARRCGEKVPRVYLSRRSGGWSKLPAAAVLTHDYRGKVVLDPALFSSAVAELVPVAPPRSRIQL